MNSPRAAKSRRNPYYVSVPTNIYIHGFDDRHELSEVRMLKKATTATSGNWQEFGNDVESLQKLFGELPVYMLTHPELLDLAKNEIGQETGPWNVQVTDKHGNTKTWDTSICKEFQPAVKKALVFSEDCRIDVYTPRFVRQFDEMCKIIRHW